MSHSAYIVLSELLLVTPPRDAWHATTIPADPSQSLVVVEWDNPNFEVEFESLPGVRPLGRPWEPLPADAVPLLASFQEPTDASVMKATPTILEVDVPANPETVASALREMNWPGARLVR